VTDAPVLARLAAHPFRPSCLREELERHLDRQGETDRGIVSHALVGLLHDIDHGACPRCQGRLRGFRSQIPAGSRVTSCRCIPICSDCETLETREASIGVVYPVFDWYHDRSVRAEVEDDLAEIDAGERSSVLDLAELDDPEQPVG
jgi:hypothetical protein